MYDSTCSSANQRHFPGLLVRVRACVCVCVIIHVLLLAPLAARPVSCARRRPTVAATAAAATFVATKHYQ